jgi:hypothetical protein
VRSKTQTRTERKKIRGTVFRGGWGEWDDDGGTKRCKISKRGSSQTRGAAGRLATEDECGRRPRASQPVRNPAAAATQAAPSGKLLARLRDVVALQEVRHELGVRRRRQRVALVLLDDGVEVLGDGVVAVLVEREVALRWPGGWVRGWRCLGRQRARSREERRARLKASVTAAPAADPTHPLHTNTPAPWYSNRAPRAPAAP